MTSGWEAVAMLAVGLAAGTVNTIVGSGGLIVFPTLLGFGYSPLIANTSQTLGLVMGSLSGTVGYRAELKGYLGPAFRLGITSVLGGITGALLLLLLPIAAFQRAAPLLIAFALLLIVFQPWLNSWLNSHRGEYKKAPSWLTAIAFFACGVYGGYFGPAQGVLLISALALLVQEDLQRLNGVKNLLAMLANLAATLIFLGVGKIALIPALLIAVGAIVGGQIGAKIGRQLSPSLLRVVIVVVGVIAIFAVLRLR